MESWRTIDRDDAKRRFRLGEADILLCTDAAAEGLNFQFCGALVNYDMPWNPMRVEQRIGRIDRLGAGVPRHPHREPPLRRHSRDGRISSRSGSASTCSKPWSGGYNRSWRGCRVRSPIRCSLVAKIGRRAVRETREAVERQARETEAGGGFDLEQVLAEDLTMPERADPPIRRSATSIESSRRRS